MTLEYASPIERQITYKLIDTLLHAGYALSVNDGEETTLKNSTTREDILTALNTTGQDYIIVSKDSKRIGQVYVVWGNDRDLISDYSSCLDSVLEPVMQYIESINQ
jgi:hypothetical protein